MRRRQKNRKIRLIYTIVSIVLFLGLFSCIFALINATNSNIISNVKINNIDVSKLSKGEAEEKLEKAVESVINDRIILKHGKYETAITFKQIELKVDVKEKVYQACTIGRDRNIIINNYKILQTMIFGENIEFDFKFNEEIIESLYNTLDEEWKDKFIDNGYYIEGDKLIIVKGREGFIIDNEKLKEKLIETIRLKIEGKEISEIEIPVIKKVPEQIDIEKIRNEIYKEAKDASYDESTSTLYTHVNGVDFAISIDEARQILQEDKEEYEIPLEIIVPNITTDKLGEEAFPEKLAYFSTRYDASNTNRATNIELACETINGTILLPNEVFSFNGTVGPRTKSKGYKLAGAYSAGELIESYGGGVCQVSSTIYNAALYANLEIVERYNHSAVVSYVDCGRDATVSYGVRDFKFKNSRTYAIKLKASARNGILTIEIWGIPEKEEYVIELSSEVTDIIVCNTKYIYDKKLAKDEEIVDTIGANGAKSIAYKTVMKNGVIVSKTVLSEDSYNPMTRTIRTGDNTKK